MHPTAIRNGEQVATTDEGGRPVDYGRWTEQARESDEHPLYLTPGFATKAVTVVPCAVHTYGLGPSPEDYEQGRNRETDTTLRSGPTDVLYRHGVGVQRGGRWVDQGAPIDGERAYAFGLAVCIDNDGGTARESAELTAAGREVYVAPGTVVRVLGRLYVIGYTGGGEWLTLAPATVRAPSSRPGHQPPAITSGTAPTHTTTTKESSDMPKTKTQTPRPAEPAATKPTAERFPSCPLCGYKFPEGKPQARCNSKQACERRQARATDAVEAVAGPGAVDALTAVKQAQKDPRWGDFKRVHPEAMKLGSAEMLTAWEAFTAEPAPADRSGTGNGSGPAAKPAQAPAKRSRPAKAAGTPKATAQARKAS